MNFKEVSIVGSGISGLTAGCALLSKGIKTNIYERSDNVSEFGAGITLSANATCLLDRLDILSQLTKVSYLPKKIIVRQFSTGEEIARMSINSNKANEFITTDRRDLIKVLLDRYQSLGGEVQNSSEVSEIYPEDNQLILSDNRKQKAEVILASDGIRSNIRGRYFDNSKPIFTYFLAWRGLTDISNLPVFEDSHEINLYYGPGGHVVHYPTGKEGTVNFVGIRESKKWTKESWREEGLKADLLRDFKGWNSDLLKLMTSPQNLYKWGIFERPKIKSIKNKNIILLGDAAHPMVPFIGQGGCMAIEDSYTFGELYSKLESQEEALNKYQKIRLKRGNWIQRRSNMQAKFNHLSSPFLVKVRNLLVDKMSINGVKAVHSYDAHKEVLKVLKS